MTEKINIVFKNNGKTAKRQISFLLSHRADWQMESNPFMIVDIDLKKKIEGQTFTDRPVEQLLVSKYPYLKTVLEEEAEEIDEPIQTEDDTEDQTDQDAHNGSTEATQTKTVNQDALNYEALLEGSIKSIKQAVEENESIDIQTLIDLETEDRNRSTLLKYLNENNK
jgi:hypothetical protein